MSTNQTINGPGSGTDPTSNPGTTAPSGGTATGNTGSTSSSYPPSMSAVPQMPPMMMAGMPSMVPPPPPPVVAPMDPSGYMMSGIPHSSGPGFSLPPIPLAPMTLPPMSYPTSIPPPQPGSGAYVGAISIPSGMNPFEFIENAFTGGGIGAPPGSMFGGPAGLGIGGGIGGFPTGPAPTSSGNTSSFSSSSDDDNSTEPPKAKKLKTSNDAKKKQGHSQIGLAAPPSSAIISEPKPPPTDKEAWKKFIKNTPSCGPAEGIKESSTFHLKHHAKSSGRLAPLSSKTLKRLFQEFDQLTTSLPVDDPRSSVWIRFDEETPQYMRAVIAASLVGSSPYAGGLFAFDMFVPASYPLQPPQVHLLNTSQTRNGFGPNLYRSGKVCLSLLGTWSGPGWDPKASSIYQVLMSIQGLILGVEHPYYLEPGHGGWEGAVKEGAFQQPTTTPTSTTVTTGAAATQGAGTSAAADPPGSSTLATTKPSSKPSSKSSTSTGKLENESGKEPLLGDQIKTREVGIPLHVVLYEDELRVSTCLYAIMDPMHRASKPSSFWHPFKDIIDATFYQNHQAILFEIGKWISDETVGRNRDLARAQYRTEQLMIDKVTGALPSLKKKLQSLSMPNYVPQKTGADKSKENDAENSENTAVAECAKTIEKIKSKISAKDKTMESYAKKKDYIKAGQIQAEMAALNEELDRLEKLRPTLKRMEESMNAAAKKKDYIKAGFLQKQMKELMKEEPRGRLPTTTKGKGKKVCSSTSKYTSTLFQPAIGSHGTGSSETDDGLGILAGGWPSGGTGNDDHYDIDGYVDPAGLLSNGLSSSVLHFGHPSQSFGDITQGQSTSQSTPAYSTKPPASSGGGTYEKKGNGHKGK